MPEMPRTQGQGCSSEPQMAQVRMQGDRVRVPVRRKMMKVATPHLTGAYRSSFFTNPNSSIIIIFTKACFDVEINSTMCSASSFEQSLAIYMLIISCFSSSSIFSISYIYLSSYLLINYIQLLDDTQSQRPISKAPTTVADTHSPKSLPTGVFADTPVSKMIVVLMTPSIPPYTIDFKNAPTTSCPSKWLSYSEESSMGQEFSQDLILFIVAGLQQYYQITAILSDARSSEKV